MLVVTGTGDDPYDGYDRFDRVIDCLWYDYGASADAARLKYGYDRVDNRTYREDAVDTTDTHDQFYTYDGIYRLTDFERGELDGTNTGIETLAFAQEWSLDETGNWSTFKQDDDGDATWDLEQTRSSNTVNEITNVTETTGPSWATPTYDPAGNMTTVPQPTDPTATFTCTYDAWNRLVSIVDTTSSDTIAEYQYDGMKRRTLAKNYVSGSLDHTRHYYYTDDWQIVEERIDSSTDPDRQFLWGQRYTDDLIFRDRDTVANGSLDERLYCLQDDNWNVVAISDSAGDIQERYSYDAYGLVNFLTPAFADRTSSDFDWETTFSGYHRDHETQLFLVRNRYYHPRFGAWLIRDPMGYDADDLNLYRYLMNAPLSSSDPLGLNEFIWQWHHLFPKVVRELISAERLTIDPHCKEFGWMLQGRHHQGKTGEISGIHPGWENEWKEWISTKTDAGERIYKNDILDKLKDMKRDKSFAPLLNKGVQAEMDNATWRDKAARSTFYEQNPEARRRLGDKADENRIAERRSLRASRSKRTKRRGKPRPESSRGPRAGSSRRGLSRLGEGAKRAGSTVRKVNRFGLGVLGVLGAIDLPFEIFDTYSEAGRNDRSFSEQVEYERRTQPQIMWGIMMDPRNPPPT